MTDTIAPSDAGMSYTTMDVKYIIGIILMCVVIAIFVCLRMICQWLFWAAPPRRHRIQLIEEHLTIN